MSAQSWIDQLALQPHPEGGHYRVTYTAATVIPRDALPDGFTGARPVSTAIYFLLSSQGDDPRSHFSAFHRLRSDEMWHFYAGSPLAVHVVAPDGSYSRLVLGPEVNAGQHFQAVVAAGCWFASEPLFPDSYALVGCTVSPGFDFDDFELADCHALTKDYPQHAALIRRLTRS
jgi:predicted cupin superfamily sugar epimerase